MKEPLGRAADAIKLPAAGFLNGCHVLDDEPDEAVLLLGIPVVLLQPVAVLEPGHASVSADPPGAGLPGARFWPTTGPCSLTISTSSASCSSVKTPRPHNCGTFCGTCRSLSCGDGHGHVPVRRVHSSLCSSSPALGPFVYHALDLVLCLPIGQTELVDGLGEPLKFVRGKLGRQPISRPRSVLRLTSPPSCSEDPSDGSCEGPRDGSNLGDWGFFRGRPLRPRCWRRHRLRGVDGTHRRRGLRRARRCRRAAGGWRFGSRCERWSFLADGRCGFPSRLPRRAPQFGPLLGSGRFFREIGPAAASPPRACLRSAPEPRAAEARLFPYRRRPRTSRSAPPPHPVEARLVLVRPLSEDESLGTSASTCCSASSCRGSSSAESPLSETSRTTPPPRPVEARLVPDRRRLRTSRSAPQPRAAETRLFPDRRRPRTSRSAPQPRHAAQPRPAEARLVPDRRRPRTSLRSRTILAIPGPPYRLGGLSHVRMGSSFDGVDVDSCSPSSSSVSNRN